MDVSARIARHVASTTAEDVPEAALEAAKRSLLDAIGVSVAASTLAPECLPFVRLARGGGPGACSLLGFDERTSPWAAVFANGALAHALDFEDAHDPSLSHPNAQTVPVLLALAESEGSVGGRDFLAAQAVGCDLTCRLSLALGRALGARGWYPPSLLAGFGATAAAASLLRLDERQTLDAFSLVLGQLGSHGAILGSTGSVIRSVRDAFPAQAAIVSTLLARDGVAGFEAPFEGPGGLQSTYAGGEGDLTAALETLGDEYAGAGISFKPWPSCRATHAFVEGALRLRAEQGLRSEEIVAVTLTGSPAATAMIAEPRAVKLRPGTLVEAKFSIYFTVALALEVGSVTLESFTLERLADARVSSLAALIRFSADERIPIDAGRVEVETRDGRVLVAEVQEASGSPGNPLSDEALVAKFLECTAHAAAPRDEAAWAGLAERILTLETRDDVAVAVSLGHL